MNQISLPFDRSDGGADDFLVSDANRIAVDHLERWRDWPISVSVLIGPSLSGRSTLARHFARSSGGTVIDDAQGSDEHALFHAWNAAQTERRPLLMVAHDAPMTWDVALPDLKSRLAAAPHVAIAEPDEALARALIMRAFDKAGASYSPDLPDWLLRRIERSYAAVAQATRLLDEAALSSGRKISIPMAKEALQSAAYPPIVPPDPSPHQRE